MNNNCFSFQFLLVLFFTINLPLLVLFSCSDDDDDDQIIPSTFVTTFGDKWDDSGESVLQTEDGGFVVCGYSVTDTTNIKKLLLLKTDRYGQELWSRIISADSDLSGVSLQATNDGGFITCSTLSEGGKNKPYLVKTDGSGLTQWEKVIDTGKSLKPWEIQRTEDDGFIICCTKNYLLKTDEMGNLIWEYSYPATGLQSIVGALDDGYVVTGRVLDDNSKAHILVLKIDPDGNEVWRQIYGPTNEYAQHSGRCIRHTRDNNYIISGQKGVYGGQYSFLLKNDPAGKELWFTDVVASDLITHECEATQDGGYILAGEQFAAGRGAAILKYNSSGEREWYKFINLFGRTYGHSVKQTDDGGYILCGKTKYSLNTLFDVFLIKMDDNGDYDEDTDY